MPTDARYSLRSLLRTPAYSAIVILTLAAGIGANTAFFSVVNMVLLHPFPYKEPDRVAMVWQSNLRAGPRVSVSWQTFHDWRAQNHVFEEMAAFEILHSNLSRLDRPEEISLARATPELFPLLGIQAEIGRVFLPVDESREGNQVALITAGFAQRHFPQGENPLGRALSLDGQEFSVVGVLPPSFHLPALFEGTSYDHPDIWIPLQAPTAADPPEAIHGRRLLVATRLNPGMTAERAKLEMEAVNRRMAADDPTLNGWGVSVFPISVENIEPAFQTSLYLQWITLGLVLAMSCANISNLALVRWSNKRKELAVMFALGASRARVVSRMLMESVLLAAAGGILGIFVARLGTRMITAIHPNEINQIDQIRVNSGSIAYALLLTAIAVACFGLFPALWSTRRSDLMICLKGGKAVGPSFSRIFSRQLLIGVEVALAMALAVGATLLTRSFQNVLSAEAGFRSAGVLTAHLSLPKEVYGSSEKRLDFFRRLMQTLQSQPGVRSAGLIDSMPLLSLTWTRYEIEGRPVRRPADAPIADFADATPEFFDTLSIPLKSGRLFTKTEKDVVLVNETLARALWPTGSPIGQHLRRITPGGNFSWSTVIGVVGDFRQFNMETAARPELIWPAEQAMSMTVLARASSGMDAGALAPSMLQAVWSIDKDQPVAEVQTFDEVVQHSLSQRRFDTFMIVVFGALGVLLAALGIYGVVSYLAATRTRETGVRYALGATRMQVFRALIKPSFFASLTGIALGAGLSLLLGNALKSLLYGVAAFSPLICFSMAAMILAIVLVSSALAAWKSARVNPLTLLRHE
ncbi:MAG TPA: ABC transporter permease [Candidatus Angelobacter sp.]|nr:ABC transporter permease [Candidatus Angelobacter sp.]